MPAPTDGIDIFIKWVVWLAGTAQPAPTVPPLEVITTTKPNSHHLATARSICLLRKLDILPTAIRYVLRTRYAPAVRGIH